MGKSTISMAILNCYVSSPEGTHLMWYESFGSKIIGISENYSGSVVESRINLRVKSHQILWSSMATSSVQDHP